MIEFNDNPNQDNIIQLQGVGQSYDNGENWIIKNLDFIVENKPDKGQFVSIMGMSGSGKSTLLRYIAGLQNPTEGKVLINGKPVTTENRVSMVFQQYSSMPWMTVLENVALGLKFKGISKREREEKAREMIDLMGLKGQEEKFAQYPSLSGGQLQRVAIGRSLLANPEVILMDEPFGALDIKTRLQMQDLLLKIWKKFNSTIIFVTHDISEAVYLSEDLFILKSAPSHFVSHTKIDLGERSRLIKRDPHFQNLVHEIEDKMVELAGT